MIDMKGFKMYKLYDDMGILFVGSFQGCVNFMLNWTETKEAKEIYSRKELKEIFNYFESVTTVTDFYGFSIQRIKE